MRGLGHTLLLAVFIFSCVGQEYVFQGIAWINMIREYSQIVPFQEAVTMTLSGQYPCELCRMIAEKKQANQSKLGTWQKAEKKLCPNLLKFIGMFPSAPAEPYAVFVSTLVSRPETPPTPPPRWA